MYYNEKEYNTTNHYIEDIVKPSNKHFKSNVEFEEELYLLKNETCDPMEHTIKYIARELMDDYENKDYGDIEFYEWLKNQSDKSIAILAEIVNAPKLKPSIELLRPNVKNMETISIKEYKKIKCIGTTHEEWLKKLKKKYGINVLRFLRINISIS